LNSKTAGRQNDLELIATRWLAHSGYGINKRLKRFLAMYFPNSVIRRQMWQETGVRLGRGTYLNLGVSVIDDYQSGEVLLELGAHCSVGPGVIFIACSHHNNSVSLRRMGLLASYEKREKIIVQNDVWIGAHSTILPGVTIGKASIIGANSLVNRDIAPYSLAYGSPIRIIKDLRVGAGEPRKGRHD